MHGVGMYFERRSFGGLGQNLFIISCSLFCRALFVFNLLCLFYNWFFSFLFWLCPFLKNQIVCHGFVFRLFCNFSLFVFRLESSLQKNKLSSSKLVLIRFGYRGFSFLSHVLRLWFVVFSKLRWLVWITI